MNKTPSLPATIFPGQSVHFDGFMDGPAYRQLIDGVRQLNVEVTVEYDGPSGHYRECQGNQFIPQVGFAGLGYCPNK